MANHHGERLPLPLPITNIYICSGVVATTWYSQIVFILCRCLQDVKIGAVSSIGGRRSARPPPAARKTIPARIFFCIVLGYPKTIHPILLRPSRLVLNHGCQKYRFCCHELPFTFRVYSIWLGLRPVFQSPALANHVLQLGSCKAVLKVRVFGFLLLQKGFKDTQPSLVQVSFKKRKKSVFQNEDACAMRGVRSNAAFLNQGETYSSQQEVQSYCRVFGLNV